MKQEELEFKDEIGQAYRLGIFQKEYPFQFAKALAICCGMASILFFFTAIVSIFEQKIIILDILYLLMLSIGIRQLHRYHKVSVYVYTKGLYLFKKKDSQSSPHGQSICWEQIERVYKSRIGIHIILKNEFGTLLLPSAFYKLDTLYAAIERKISLYNVSKE
jgi:hypothetical protein